VLTGTLDDFTLPEMFRFLASCHKTGCIEVRRDSGDGRVFLRDGDIYFGESSVTRAAEGVEQDSDALKRQIESSFFDLLRWDGGEFTFSPDLEVAYEPSVSVDIETLITETAQKLEELGVIAAKIPSERAVTAMAPNPPADAAQINITPDEWRILVLVNGSRTVSDIAEMVGLDSFSVMRTLYGLASTGLIELVGEADASVPVSTNGHAPAESFVEPAAAFVPGSPDEVAQQLEDEFAPFPGQEDEPQASDSSSDDELQPVAELDSDTEPVADFQPSDDFSTDPDIDASADPLALGEDADDDLPVSAELVSEDEDGDEAVAEDPDPAAAVSDFEGTEPVAEQIPIEEAGAPPAAVVDRLAAVKELADLFGADSDEVGPPYTPELEAQREAEAAHVPDTRRRVEDDEEITRGLISRLIDGVKGL
jgi:hypothetical protein